MNPYQFQLLGEQASLDFINHDKSLNGSIAKMAEAHDMTPLQIQRVVEFSNHATNDELRKTAEDKTFSFPVASLDGVLTEMHAVPEGGISSLADIRTAIDSYKPEMAKVASFELESDFDRQKALKKAEQDLTKVANWSEKYEKQLDSCRVVQLEKLGEDLDELTTMSKTYLTSGHGTLSEIKKYAEHVEDAPKIWGPVFRHVENTLEKLGHPFTGLLASDKELAKDPHSGHGGVELKDQKVLVINGQAPIFKVLKHVHARMLDLSSYDLRKHELSSLSQVITDSRKILSSNDDARACIDQLGTMADASVKGPSQLLKAAGVVKSVAKLGLKAAPALGAGALATGAGYAVGKGKDAFSKTRKVTGTDSHGSPSAAESSGNLEIK